MQWCNEKPDGSYSGSEKWIIFSVSRWMILSCRDEKEPSWASVHVNKQGLEDPDRVFSPVICINLAE